MLEWDAGSELQQRDFIEESANGGFVISGHGQEYVGDADAGIRTTFDIDPE
jgi:hypothetical protein